MATGVHSQLLTAAAAAIGSVVYFVGTTGAHVRAGDRGVGAAVFVLVLAVCALLTNFAHRGRP